MHPQRVMEKVAESLAAIASLTAHTRAHDGRFGSGELEFVEWGTGTVDYATPLRMLKEAGFDGYCSVEIIHEPGGNYDADAVLEEYTTGFAEVDL